MAAVRVDVETGCTRLDLLAAVDDCGTVIHQDLVNAQLHGALAMGAGMALYEEETFTAEGLPQSTDFKRYLLPRLADMPEIRTAHLHTPSRSPPSAPRAPARVA